MVELKGYKVASINFQNEVANGTQLKLQNQVKYNVNYIESENRCVGILDFRVADADLQPFEIKIKMVAEFVYSERTKSPIFTRARLTSFFRFCDR